MGSSKKTLVKIGSNVLTLSSGLPDKERIAHLVNQMAELKTEGHQIILVSSGAVAAGRNIVKNAKGLDTISQRQVLASVGQAELMKIYSHFFQEHNIVCSQVLVSKESFRTRQHYLNIKNCLDALLKSDIIPIINENDVVSITELMFTDNDELSGLVASMMAVENMLLLSNVDGIFTSHPNEPTAKLIGEYTENGVDLEKIISDTKSAFGRGGMLSKAETAKKIAGFGVNVSIGNGTKNGILKALLNRESGTFFKANNRTTSPIKKWVAQAGDFSKACICVNEGAKKALLSEKASSLLPIGVTAINGSFKKGDVVNITDENNKNIGLGKVAYDSDKAKICLGKRDCTPLVHYNYLVLK